jgi:hypothetical protein
VLEHGLANVLLVFGEGEIHGPPPFPDRARRLAVRAKRDNAAMIG